jgi:hypothetical protein
MIGVGIQQFFILVFLVYAIGFHRTLADEQAADKVASRRATTLLYTLYLCLCFITVSRQSFMVVFPQY